MRVFMGFFFDWAVEALTIKNAKANKNRYLIFIETGG
jgi:hypothetical protein